ncbi:MAG: glycosyltransferase family 9 protein [bacterium]
MTSAPRAAPRSAPPSADFWPRPSWPLRRGWRALRRLAYELASTLAPRAEVGPLDLAALRHVVVLRDDRLGDALLATPFVRALRRACPNARITVLASTTNAAVFARLAEVDEVCVGGARWRDLPATVRRLRASGAIDLVIDLYSWTELRPAVLAWCTRARHRVGYDRDRRAFLHTRRIALRTDIRYEAERNLDLLRALGVACDEGALPRFPVRAEDVAQARQAREACALGAARDYVVLHPGSGARYQTYRRVAPATLGAVARRLTDEQRVDVWVTGSLAEAPLAQAVVRAAGVPAVQSLAGQLDLGGLAALLAGARLVVVPDTGVLHLAVAVAARVVAILGPVGDVNGPERVLPRGEGVVAARVDLGCEPLACNIQRCRRVACLTNLDAEVVGLACARALAAAARAPIAGET